jgi:hypothetical protein
MEIFGIVLPGIMFYTLIGNFNSILRKDIVPNPFLKILNTAVLKGREGSLKKGQ